MPEFAVKLNSKALVVGLGENTILAGRERILSENAKVLAEIAANTALAAGNFIDGGQTAAEAVTSEGDFFSYSDGAGGIVYAVRAAVGSTEIAQAATKALVDTKVATADLNSTDENKGAALVNFDPAKRYLDGIGPYLNNVGDRYVNVASLAPSNDSLEAFTAVQAALNQGNGREVVFSNPFGGGSRYYRFLNRGNGRLTMPQKSRLIFEPGTILDFSAYGSSLSQGIPYLYAIGTVGTAYLLTSNAATKAFTVTLTSGAGANFSAGDDIFVRSNAFFTTEDSTLGTQGEWASVAFVTGDVLTLLAPLRANYNTADGAYVTKVDPVTLNIEGLKVIGAGRFATNVLGDRGIQIINGKNCRVQDCNIARADFNGVAFLNTLASKVENTRVEFEPKGSHDANQYGIAFVNMCESTVADDCDVVGGKEAYCLTVSGQPQGVSRDVGFENCRARGAWRSGYASHDNHESWYINNCRAWDCEQGIDNRVRKFTVDGFKAYRMGAFNNGLDCAIQLGSGAGETHITGLYCEDVLRGVWMPDIIVHETLPGDITIEDAVMRKVRAHGVRLDYRTSPPGGGANSTSALGAVHIKNLDCECLTTVAGRAVELHGKWTQPIISGGIFKGGNGGTTCVFLHATSNGGGTNGAISPVVDRVIYGTGYTAPLIQHASGVTKNSGHVTIGV